MNPIPGLDVTLDVGMFYKLLSEIRRIFGITDDFDVTLTKETADAWYLTCKKSKNCTDPDVPKTMDLVVSKGTYYPKLLKAKISGVSVAMRDVSFGVKEDYVTFRLSDYPGAKVEDNRGKSKK